MKTVMDFAKYGTAFSHVKVKLTNSPKSPTIASLSRISQNSYYNCHDITYTCP